MCMDAAPTSCSWHAQASGFRLRLDIADTLLIRGGRLAAWYFTARDGTVARASEPEITEQAILQVNQEQHACMYAGSCCLQAHADIEHALTAGMPLAEVGGRQQCAVHAPSAQPKQLRCAGAV